MRTHCCVKSTYSRGRPHRRRIATIQALALQTFLQRKPLRFRHNFGFWIGFGFRITLYPDIAFCILLLPLLVWYYSAFVWHGAIGLFWLLSRHFWKALEINIYGRNPVHIRIACTIALFGSSVYISCDHLVANFDMHWIIVCIISAVKNDMTCAKPHLDDSATRTGYRNSDQILVKLALAVQPTMIICWFLTFIVLCIPLNIFASLMLAFPSVFLSWMLCLLLWWSIDVEFLRGKQLLRSWYRVSFHCERNIELPPPFRRTSALI